MKNISLIQKGDNDKGQQRKHSMKGLNISRKNRKNLKLRKRNSEKESPRRKEKNELED